MIKNYQRRHLRAPFREYVLYEDNGIVLKGLGRSLSEGGMLLDEVPRFPLQDEFNLMFSLKLVPILRNFSLERLQTFHLDIFQKHILRAKVRVVRREEFNKDINNLFKLKLGLEFTSILPGDQKFIEDYVAGFSSNIIYLQTLIDSFNASSEIQNKVRVLAKILGYDGDMKISQLRSVVAQDYKNLQWL